MINNAEYENFFRSFCDEGQSIKYARLNRCILKQFLQERYSKFVTEKILTFLENEFVPLLRIDFRGWCIMLMDFLNAGPELHKRLLFACLGLTNTGRICEHDLYSIMESFRERKINILDDI